VSHATGEPLLPSYTCTVRHNFRLSEQSVRLLCRGASSVQVQYCRCGLERICVLSCRLPCRLHCRSIRSVLWPCQEADEISQLRGIERTWTRKLVLPSGEEKTALPVSSVSVVVAGCRENASTI